MSYSGVADPLALANLTRGAYTPLPMFGPPISMGAGGVGAIPGLGSFGAAPTLAGQIPTTTLASDAFMAADRGLATQLGRAVSGNPLALNVTKATAGKALGYAGLGMLGSGLADRYTPGSHNSNIEQGLQGAALGAGTGAAIGSVVPGLGTGIGAAVGGIAGGAIGVLSNVFGGGGEAADPREQGEEILANAIMQAGIDDAAASQIIDTYDTLLALSEGLEGDEKAAAEAAALDQAGQLVLGALQTREQTSAAATNTLALQQQAGAIFQPLADDIRQSTLAYANAMGGIRDQLPDEYRAIADATVAREMSSGNKLADAYMAQAAITPVVNQLTQYQQDFNSYAAQLFAQQLAQGAAAGGGQADISALLQPTG